MLTLRYEPFTIFPPSNDKISEDEAEALRHAREKLTRGQEQYICFALENVGSNHPELSNACASMTHKIDKALGPLHATLITWALAKGDIVAGGTRGYLKYRIAWIDHMLANLSPIAA